MKNRQPHVFVLVFCLSLLSCSGLKYSVDKASPKGTYRVLINLRDEKPTGTRDYTEYLKVQYFKGQELVYEYQSENSDQYEPSMKDGLDVVEWVSENVLLTETNLCSKSFNDVIIVSNNTHQHFKQMGISYGRNQNFQILDFPEGSELILQASPGFCPDGSSNYFLGYGGTTQDGRWFDGALEQKQRTSPAEGPLKFQIEVSETDLHFGIRGLEQSN